MEKLVDFIIGLTLMNSMPHFILGVWKGTMVSGFGVGHRRNIIWALCNFIISIGLFLYNYGLNGLQENLMYSGALLVLVTFFFTSRFWYKYFYKNKSE
jgi:hypothetical protein